MMTYFQTQKSLYYKAHTLVQLLQSHVAEAVRNKNIFIKNTII